MCCKVGMTAPSHDRGNLTPVSHHCLELDWSRGVRAGVGELVTIGNRNKNHWMKGQRTRSSDSRQDASAQDIPSSSLSQFIMLFIAITSESRLKQILNVICLI